MSSIGNKNGYKLIDLLYLNLNIWVGERELTAPLAYLINLKILIVEMDR